LLGNILKLIGTGGFDKFTIKEREQRGKK